MADKKNKFLELSSVILILFIFVSGCATAPKITQENAGPIFWPPAPEAPRLQFLTSFSSSGDLEAAPGTFRKFILGDEKSTKPIVKPYGVAAHGNKIYICDTVLNSIDVLDIERRKFEYFRPKKEGQLIAPINLSFDTNGDMYVADSRRGQVVIFDEAGNSLGAIGNKSEFKPTDVAIRGDKIYVCDIKTHSIRIFGLKDRQYLSSIPAEDAAEEAKLFSPTNMAVDEEGDIYVSDMGSFKVQKYSSDGKFLMSIGSQGDAAGQFSRPKGITVDKEGRVYVVDAAFENVQIFDKEGKLLLFFGEPGGSASLVLPAGVTIDYALKDYFSSLADPSFEIEYLVFVTSQYGDRKLSVFGFGHKR